MKPGVDSGVAPPGLADGTARAVGVTGPSRCAAAAHASVAGGPAENALRVVLVGFDMRNAGCGAASAVGMVSAETLAESGAFRGGIALHGLFVAPRGRYGEDTDSFSSTPLPSAPRSPTDRDDLGGGAADVRDG